jgi:hypothetical protein
MTGAENSSQCRKRECSAWPERSEDEIFGDHRTGE